MKNGRKTRRAAREVALMVFCWALSAPSTLFACAACYGQADGPMARAMNWGILSLLGVIVLVLAGVAGFFVFLVKRGAAAAMPAPMAESTERI